MLRMNEPGWTLLVMHDPAIRRGLWCRETEGKVELCAGREGGDDYVMLKEGAAITPEMLADVRGLCATMRWVEDLGEIAAERDEARLTLINAPVCGLQFPDGSVPTNVVACAEGWKREYERACREREEIRTLMLRSHDHCSTLSGERFGLGEQLKVARAEDALRDALALLRASIRTKHGIELMALGMKWAPLVAADVAESRLQEETLRRLLVDEQRGRADALAAARDMRDERDEARAEVERLRGAASEALEALDIRCSHLAARVVGRDDAVRDALLVQSEAALRAALAPPPAQEPAPVPTTTAAPVARACRECLGEGVMEYKPGRQETCLECLESGEDTADYAFPLGPSRPMRRVVPAPLPTTTAADSDATSRGERPRWATAAGAAHPLLPPLRDDALLVLVSRKVVAGLALVDEVKPKA